MNKFLMSYLSTGRKIYYLLFLVTLVDNIDGLSDIKFCKGIDNLESGHHSNPVPILRDAYANCTHILNHLLIQNLGKGDDVSFLDSIVEVYGSVVLESNKANFISLKNLKVIRGQKNKDWYLGKYSFYMYGPQEFVGNATLDIGSLRSILSGSVYIGNNNFCHLKHFQWNSLLEDTNAQLLNIKPSSTRLECRGSVCSTSCGEHCFGPGPNMCQKMTECSKFHRCFKSNGIEKKCNRECIGGCYGPSSNQCVACNTLSNDGNCVNKCPEKYIDTKRNPDFKYIYHDHFCVKKCPKGFSGNDNKCIKRCPQNRRDKDGECIPCINCSTVVCVLKHVIKQIPIPIYLSRAEEEDITVTRSLLRKLQNCTEIVGHLTMNTISTDPIDIGKNETVRAEDLQYLSNIRRITGAIHLDISKLSKMTNLSFFRNLEEINSVNDNIEIFCDSASTNLRYLGWKNLKSVTAKELIIEGCSNICYTKEIKEFFQKQGITSYFTDARSYNSCQKEVRICDKTCNELGCWGPGPNLCVQCKRHRINDICVNRCEEMKGYYTRKNQTECGVCHKECNNSCSGPGAHECLGGCKNLKDGNRCVAACPSKKFADTKRVCQKCHASCYPLSPVCTGLSNILGIGGCNFCKKIQITKRQEMICLEKRPEAGYFEAHYDRANIHEIKPMLQNRTKIPESLYNEDIIVYRPCHPRCRNCDGTGINECRSCQPGYYHFQRSCLATCPEDESFYKKTKKNTTVCQSCHFSCKGCNGPTVHDCKSCKDVKIYIAGSNQEWYCNSTCPKEMPHVAIEDGEQVCSDTSDYTKYLIMVVAIAAGCTVIGIWILIGVLYYRRLETRKAIMKEDMIAKYTRKGFDEITLDMSEHKPDSSHLKVIGSNQLKKESFVGNGAFGTVYRGIWTPLVGDKSVKKVEITVAIKELKDNDSKRSIDEFLSEARLMASVSHPCCMKLLGACLADRPMLVSEFMPLGNLKDYLIDHRDTIGSQLMLRWALLIAEGMDYLSSRNIVHRDLAARNVLLAKGNEIRITDFGLAKLTNGDKEFRDCGQKLPIRWLAMECIRTQTFSMWSDVWAYGVTLWEIFSYGESPYSELRLEGILEYLEYGERLPQPTICTLDMYMILIKCWLADPECRPTFGELKEELKKMAVDPGRYLMIENDILTRAPWSVASPDVLEKLHPTPPLLPRNPVMIPHTESDSRFGSESFCQGDDVFKEDYEVPLVKSRQNDAMAGSIVSSNYVNTKPQGLSVSNPEYEQPSAASPLLEIIDDYLIVENSSTL